MRILTDIDQGTPEWRAARCGIPTASAFARILAGKETTAWVSQDGIEYPTKVAAKEAGLKTKDIQDLVRTEPRFSLELSDGARGYVYELLAETLIVEAEPDWRGGYALRGTNMEAEARALFTFDTGIDIEPVGFILDDDLGIGASPDGFRPATVKGNPVIDQRHSDHTGLEIKCPALRTHLQYIHEGRCPDDYVPQVQGSMFITGASSWWFMSYHPDFESLIIKVEADPRWQSAFAALVNDFNSERAKVWQEIQSAVAVRKAA